MPAAPIYDLEWLNANSQRAYPLSELASKKDTTGSLQLRDDLIVDLSFAVPYSASIDLSLFHIHSISVFSLGLIITIGYNGAIAGMASVTDVSGTKNVSYPIVGAGDFAGATGCIVIGSTAGSMKTPGVYSFTVDAARLEPTTIKPEIRSVSSLLVQNGTDVSSPLVGVVTLEAGSNIVLATNSTDPLNPVVTISAQVLETSLLGRCPCEDQAAQAITSINGVAPDSNGNMTLDGNACIAITGSTPVITLTDKCSTPCCGCSELAVVTADLALLDKQAEAMEQTLTTLEERYTDLVTTLAASRLGIGTWS